MKRLLSRKGTNNYFILTQAKASCDFLVSYLVNIFIEREKCLRANFPLFS